MKIAFLTIILLIVSSYSIEKAQGKPQTEAEVLDQIGNRNQDKAVDVLYVAGVNVDKGIESKYSKLFRDTIISQFSKIKKYRLANLETNYSIEKVKNYNECISSVDDCARREAESEAADLVLITEITKIDTICRLNMRLKDVRMKETLNNEQKDANCNFSNLEEKLKNLVYLVIKEKFKRASSASGKRDAFFSTNPEGAIVIVDGENLGMTPLKTKIKTGKVKISLEIDNNHDPINLLVTIEESSKVFEFKQSFSLKDAYLIIEVKPDGAEIKIDGKPALNESNKFPVSSSEEHEIEISMDKYITQSFKTPKLDGNEEKIYIIDLEPDSCHVKFTSEPFGALVSLNEEEMGETNFEKKISQGNHKISVRKKDYDPQELSFYCSSGDTIHKHFILKKSRYTTEEQERIDRSKRWRLISYGGFLASAGLGYMAYKSYEDYHRIDKKYLSSKDPFEIQRFAKSRDEAKNSLMIYSASSAVGIGLSYLFYRWGEFPNDLWKRDRFTFSSQRERGGGSVAWNYRW